MKHLIFVYLILFISTCTTKSEINKNDSLFAEMKNIRFMKNIKTGEIKPFKFVVSNLKIESKFDKKIKYYKSYMSYFGEFYLGIKNNVLYSRTGRIYQKVLDFKGDKILSGAPFGSHYIYLEKTEYDKNEKDSLYIFTASEIETFDVDYSKNDSIEVKRIVLSKKRGFLELLIKEKFSNELYLARFGNGTE